MFLYKSNINQTSLLVYSLNEGRQNSWATGGSWTHDQTIGLEDQNVTSPLFIRFSTKCYGEYGNHLVQLEYLGYYSFCGDLPSFKIYMAFGTFKMEINGKRN